MPMLNDVNTYHGDIYAVRGINLILNPQEFGAIGGQTVPPMQV
jgi:hypothetical protein